VIVARVVNDKGRAFNVRLVCKGDRHGLRDCLVHDKDEPLVEFWDATYKHDPRFSPGLGQFASSYYLSTLTERRSLVGLDLCGHEPAWKLTAGNVVDAVAAAAAEVARG
jgi:hypothetical protein